MKHLLAVCMLSVIVYAADAPSDPKVIAAPFEPPIERFFKRDDKFAHPPELITPRFYIPDELMRGGDFVPAGEVVVLVQLDEIGRAKQLKVLSSPHHYFALSAIEALKKAKWESAGETWFYYRHVYSYLE